MKQMFAQIARKLLIKKKKTFGLSGDYWDFA
jgi:hypothetical protein